jgi:uncharacterized protein involved in type VI secretion and phage assembly
MSFLDPKGPVAEPPRNRLYGVYPALVTAVKDMDPARGGDAQQGRIEVKLPWVDEEEGESARVWARLATFLAGGDRGSWFIPDPGDEVLISFVAGDPRWPVVIGSLWNGVDQPPETMDAEGQNNIRSFTSRLGHKLTFDDGPEAKVEVKTSAGHDLVLDDANQEIRIQHLNGASIVIDQQGTITVTAIMQVNVLAPMGVQVTAPTVTVNSPISQFSGIVQAEQVITQSINSGRYNNASGNAV